MRCPLAAYGEPRLQHRKLPSASACLIALAMGIMRSTASWVAVTGSVLTSSPPWATTTTPRSGDSVPGMEGMDALSLMAPKHAGCYPLLQRNDAAPKMTSSLDSDE